jgi:hypothetical protein
MQADDGHGEKQTTAGKPPARISTPALSELQAALKAYHSAVETSDLSQSSQATYMDMAENFVRWLKGDFNPGSRKAPYSLKRKKDTIAS